ncbi:hypothetical protein [Mycobacterium sp. 1274761.0]|uniref:hypothetical protein n=1 Tax=Mycobacterium sp. 1274761.0 TaxID=1834077 RepID=UPI0007FEA9AA|nr:hypothetical protein [Mycobacterium sp. 1274761.0]OBK78194.1 hypothetical protein A5651_03010 [Mycobacterium sp. 1274761.0]
MNPDALCTSDSWSPFTAASAYSQLAGVLGGFLITAIALLFDRNGREAVHTLALFSSAVLILMLNSFVFSMMTGNQVPAEGDRSGICAIAWTQNALSIGMLAAGAVGLFGGLGWMLSTHAVNKLADLDADEVRPYSFLSNLGSWLTFAAAMAATLILSETAIDYLHFMFGRRPDFGWVALITVSAAVMVVIDFALIYLRTRTLRRSLADPEQPTLLATRSIKVATVGIVALAIVASWLAVSLNRFPKSWLTAPNIAVVVAVLFLSFVVPAVVSIAICDSAASTEKS